MAHKGNESRSGRDLQRSLPLIDAGDDGHRAPSYYCQRVLDALNGEGPRTLDGLARAIADRDFDGSGLTPKAADYARTRRELASVYLPELLAADLITDLHLAGRDLFVRADTGLRSDPFSISDVI